MILDTGNYYAELREDGTYVKHHCRFVQQQGDITLRVELDPATNKQTGASVVTPKVLYTVDAVTGEFCGEQRGFVLDHELGMMTPPAGKRYLRLADSAMPADFKQQGVIAYTCDGTQFVPLPAAELARRIELKKQPESI